MGPISARSGDAIAPRLGRSDSTELAEVLALPAGCRSTRASPYPDFDVLASQEL